MNAYEENYQNEKHITKHKTNGYTVFEIDPMKVTWHGWKVRELGAYGRRKFENLLVIINSQERIKIVYLNV